MKKVSQPKRKNKRTKEVVTQIIREPTTIYGPHTRMAASLDPWRAKEVKIKSGNLPPLSHPSGVSIIRNENDEKRLVAKYCKCLVSPYDYATRIPDTEGSASTLIRSRRTFDLTVDPSKGGKFALFVQPKMGSLKSPSNYQIGVLDMAATNNDPDPTDRASYITPEILAIDQQLSLLAQPSSKTLGLSSTAGYSPTKPLGNLDVWVPTDLGEPLNYNVEWNVSQPVPDGGVNYAVVNIPAGTYLIDLDTTTDANTAAGQNMPLLAAVRRGGSTGSVVLPNSLIVLNQVGGGSTGQSSQFLVNIEPEDRLWFQKNPAVLQNLTRVRLIIQTTVSNHFLSSFAYGAIEQLRPVGCSVLVKNVMPDIASGGTIYSTATTPGSMDKIFSESETRWYDNNNLVSKFPDAHRGAVKDGTYVWWKPVRAQDRFYLGVPEQNSIEYSILLITGQVNSWTTDTITTPQVAFQVTVEQTFEVLQNTQLFEKKKEVTSKDLMPMANATIATLRQATENKTHTDLIDDVASVVKNVVGIGAFLAGIF